MKKIKVISLTIGAWYVRTLMDSAGSDRPQRRTGLVGRERSVQNRREGNDQEPIQLSHTSHQRHQRERNTNTK